MKNFFYFSDTTVDYSPNNSLDIANSVQMFHVNQDIFIILNDNSEAIMIRTRGQHKGQA